jgi:hypothetical protein
LVGHQVVQMGANLVIISLPPVGNEADRVRDN